VWLKYFFQASAIVAKVDRGFWAKSRIKNGAKLEFLAWAFHQLRIGDNIFSPYCDFYQRTHQVICSGVLECTRFENWLLNFKASNMACSIIQKSNLLGRPILKEPTIQLLGLCPCISYYLNLRLDRLT